MIDANHALLQEALLLSKFYISRFHKKSMAEEIDKLNVCAKELYIRNDRMYQYVPVQSYLGSILMLCPIQHEF